MEIMKTINSERLLLRPFQESDYDKLYPNNTLQHITPHVARHTFATRMAQSGMDVKALQYLLGHSDAGVTMNVYTHTSYDFAAKQLKKIQPSEEAAK